MRRSMIKKAKNQAKKFFTEQLQFGKNSKIYKSCKSVLRTDKFSIDYHVAFRCLNHINFIYDSINDHWAETDGKSISINMYKTYTDELLTLTLIHEAIHYIVHRNFRHEIYEAKEHKIMYLTDSLLI